MSDKLLFWAEKATEFEEENKLLEQRINLLQIAGDEAIKQRNDALRERDEARAENVRLREAIEELLSCPMAVDQATVPMAGIESAPHQVVLNMSVGLLRLEKAKQALGGSENDA